MSRKLWVDIAERAGWTFAQALVALFVAHQADLSTEWAPVVAAGLAILKGLLASRVGDKESAATLPS